MSNRSKSVPKLHHRSPRRARDRILAAADGWAYIDGADSNDTGCQVVESLIDAAFDTCTIGYPISRAMLVALVDRAPRPAIIAMSAIAGDELAAVAEYRDELERTRKISELLDCSLDEAERIVRLHKQRDTVDPMIAIKASLGIAEATS